MELVPNRAKHMRSPSASPSFFGCAMIASKSGSAPWQWDRRISNALRTRNRVLASACSGAPQRYSLELIDGIVRFPTFSSHQTKRRTALVPMLLDGYRCLSLCRWSKN